MLQGDSCVSQLHVTECLNAVEFALTDRQYDYTPYTWQVHMSDSKKGRMLAVAKARPQSDEHPSFSLNVDLKTEEDKTTLVAWSFDATAQCAEIAEKTNSNLREYLAFVQAQPVVAAPVVKVKPSSVNPSGFSSSKPFGAAFESGKSATGAVSAGSKPDLNVQSGTDEPSVPGVIPELRSGRSQPGPYYAAPSAPVHNAGNRGATNGTTKSSTGNSTYTESTQSENEPVSISGWLRHFFFGD